MIGRSAPAWLSSLHEPYSPVARSLQWPHGLRRDANAAGRARRRGRRGRVGRAAAARQARVRRRLRRRRAARRASRACARPPRYPVGLALHVANGAAFGALYANVAPSLPGPGAVRGAAAGLAEHLATWPGTLVIDRLSLGRDFPKLWGDPRAFAQATWRHLLFGARARRARAAAEPAGGGAGADRRGRRRLERARLGRAPGRRRVREGASSRAPAGFAGAPSRRRTAGRRATTSPRPRARDGHVDLRDAAAARAAVARGAARRRLPPRRARPRRRVVGGPGGASCADNVAMTLNVLEAVRAEAPGRDRRGGRLRRGLRPARSALPVDEDAPLRPQNPYAVSKASADLLAGFYADAHGLRVIRAARVQPRRAGPGADLRDRLVLAPGRRRRPSAARTRSRFAHRQPGHAPRLHRRARRRARLPAARRARRAGHLQRLLGPLDLGARAARAARRRPPAPGSTTGSTRRSCARTR